MLNYKKHKGGDNMPFIAMKCPQCSGDIDYEDTRDIMFCKYCGTKILREQIVNIIQTGTMHDAQWYFDNWLQLREKRMSSNDYSTQQAFRELDVEFTKLYCNDYRRIFADAIELTNNFSPRRTWERDTDIWDYTPLDSIYTHVDIGGLGKEDELKQIRVKIASVSNCEQAKKMLKKIDEHLAQLEKVNSELIPGLVPRNIIKVEKKKKGLFGLW